VVALFFGYQEKLGQSCCPRDPGLFINVVLNTKGIEEKK
jgi:hypothetical protein